LTVNLPMTAEHKTAQTDIPSSSATFN